MSGLELNVENYTIDELLKILKVDPDNPSIDEISNQTNTLKEKYKSDPGMFDFLSKVEDKIFTNLDYENTTGVNTFSGDYEDEDKQYSKWITEQYLDNNDNEIRKQKMTF